MPFKIDTLYHFPIIIPDATAQQDGLLTSEGFSALTQSIATDDVLIYVDATSGNDANPGTSALPIQTFLHALELVPARWTKACQIHLVGAGPFVMPDSTEFTIGTPVGPYATPLAIVGSMTNVYGNQVIDGGSSARAIKVTFSSPPVDGALRGAFLHNKTTGQVVEILGNTTVGPQTTITTNANISSTAAQTVAVERPAAVLETSPDGFPVFRLVGGVIGFVDVKFVTDPTSAAQDAGFAFVGPGQVYMQGCEYDGGVNDGFLNFVNEVTVAFATTGAPWLPAGSLDPFNPAAGGAGLYLHSSGPSGTFVALETYCRTSGHLLIDNGEVSPLRSCFVQLTSLNGVGSILFADKNCVLDISEGTFDGDGNFAPADGIGLRESRATLASGSGTLTVKNMGGSGLALQQGSYARVNRLAGTGNGDYGMSVQKMSQIAYTAGNTVITGTGGDTVVGASVKAYGSLPFSEVLASGPSLNAIQ